MIGRWFINFDLINFLPRGSFSFQLIMMAILLYLQVTPNQLMCVPLAISVPCQQSWPHPLMVLQVISVLQAGTARQVVSQVWDVQGEHSVTH